MINLAVMWGLGTERGVEAIGREARSAVVQAEMKRRSYKGVIDVIYGGEQPARPVEAESKKEGRQEKGKRKAQVMEVGDAEVVAPKLVSKREQKRQAKKARLEAAKSLEAEATSRGTAIHAQEDPPLPSPSLEGGRT